MSVFLQWAIFLAVTAMAVAASAHALLYKRDPRASLGWIAVCVLFPAVGPVLYFLFGVNRIRIKADKLESHAPFRLAQLPEEDEQATSDAGLPEKFRALDRVSLRASGRPLLGGNGVKALHNGEEAYPEMIRAINQATETCYLSSYIFETNKTGREFISALARAKDRGVDVRVLIDGLGEKYSLPWAGRLLAKAGVRYARFLPPTLIPPQFSINLRNHRKILVCDGCTSFVGGMNIGERHMVEGKKRSPTADMHFKLSGPVVAQIEEIFLWDWGYSTDEYTKPHRPRAKEKCCAYCRCIADGPNDEMDKLTMIMAGAINSARRKVRVMTPYFLPPASITAAMQTAALRGVDVAVILPQKNNLPLVHWATRNMLWEILQRGVRVYYQPPPFNHTKLLSVDNMYVHVGSANLDPRSLRLNFELGLEVYDREFAKSVNAHFDAVREQSRETSLQEMDSRPKIERVRDSVCWLFSPYM
jgi:cardiolipin synthase